MPKFRVFTQVWATVSVDVEADNAEQAREKYENDHMESPIDICHQCSRFIQDPVFGEPVEIAEIEGANDE